MNRKLEEYGYPPEERAAILAASAAMADVEVARIGPDGVPGTFEQTTKLTIPSTQAPHEIMLPLVTSGAGWLVVVGGQTSADPASLTNVVLAAKIDAATGKLGAWVAPPKFPTPITAAAIMIVNRTILVFGGLGTSGLSDAVMALKILPDDTFEAAWQRVAKLPGPRANLAAVEY
jgi:hypothetical protein